MAEVKTANRNGAARQRMSRPHDARAVRSLEALRSALLKLIETRSFEAITIREITQEAGVSYPVFFRRFASKEELLDDIAQEEVRQLLSHTRPALDSGATAVPFEGLCRYVQDHRTLWTTLLTAGASSVMRQEFMRVANEDARDRPRQHPWLPLDLATSVVASIIFEILSWWLQQEESYPVENVRILLEVLAMRSLNKPRTIDLLAVPPVGEEP